MNNTSLSERNTINTVGNVPGRSLHFLDQEPIAGACTVFDSYLDHSLKDIVHQWQLLALSSKATNSYAEGIDRANLVQFCTDLWQAIEALRLLCSIPEQDRQQTEQKASAMETIMVFRSKYSWKHSRAELFLLMDAAVSYSGPVPQQRDNLVWDFEALLCTLTALHLY
jgi:hypothetical protein